MTEVALYRFNNRLAQFRKEGGQKDFWEERWSKSEMGVVLSSHRNGKLDEFENLFSRHLPHDLPILEAGCGMGQLVMALKARGYCVEGIDYASETVSRLQTIAPELNIRVGDVYRLDVPDSAYGGYISVGIFEHNPDGPLDGLREVKRVLHPRGVALISVPYLNPERQTWLERIPVAEHQILPNDLRFYQYYFSRDEFASLLRKAGLQVVEIFPYGAYSGLTRDFSLGLKLDARNFYHWRLKRRFSRLCARAPMWARWRWAHMIMFVCKGES